MIARGADRRSAASASSSSASRNQRTAFDASGSPAVINPPQAAILAVGAALPEPLPDPDGTGVQVHQLLRLTLSIDRRALDGATGARFLQQLKTVLEHPLQIVA